MKNKYQSEKKAKISSTFLGTKEVESAKNNQNNFYLKKKTFETNNI